MSLASRVCEEAGQAGQERCLFETRTAFDCVLRQKVQKGGNIYDNAGACANQISWMKEALGPKAHDAIDAHLESVIYARKSFV